jgi:SlyX protein
MTTPDRLEDIEVKLAHLEHALGEINAVVIRQQQELEQLRTQQQRLHQQLAAGEAQSASASATGFEKPPHY